MSKLAIVTDIGRAHERRGRDMLREFCGSNRSEFIATPPSHPCDVDGFAVRNGEIVAVLEAKSRTGYSLYDMQRMGATLLISQSKLEAMMDMARRLGVPAILVAQFEDSHRWYWRIANPDGTPSFAWECRKSVTKSDSVGGADVVRLNAFLPLDSGVCWQAPSEAVARG
jgi:hypothetical protein